ncbi:MAG: DUF2163 domain-containing protein [Litoreibacter sp.]
MSFASHIKSGLTTLCRCWEVRRKDGQIFGFTDHDSNLSFAGTVFKADTGLTASALQQVTGLAVDNTEAIGALSATSLTEKDIAAGRFDGARVTHWLVNWQDVEEREIQFAGSLGEIKRGDGAFYAELRGASEALNKPMGSVFQKPCQALLGDGKCGIDLTDPSYRANVTIAHVDNGRIFEFTSLNGYQSEWFEKGRLTVLGGEGASLSGIIKRDSQQGGIRTLELWEELRASIVAGDMVRIEAGCDKRHQTCREKFANLLNFRGFPNIPGEDWLMTYPTQDGVNDGGSRQS